MNKTFYISDGACENRLSDEHGDDTGAYQVDQRGRQHSTYTCAYVREVLVTHSLKEIVFAPDT